MKACRQRTERHSQGISFQKNALKPIFDLQKVYYYRVFIEVTKAHVVMLREQDLMTEDECALILSTMLDLEKLPIEESEYNPAYEDLFLLFEKELENRVGSDLAGKVHTARSLQRHLRGRVSNGAA